MFTDLIKYINWKNPLYKFVLFLSFFGIIATADLLFSTINPQERMQYIENMLFVFLTSAVVYLILRYGFKLTISNPLNFLVSTWITYLLIHPTNPLLYFVIAIIAIPVGKFLFRKNKLPIFNPTALGLVITYGITLGITMFTQTADTLLVSWWGADMFQSITSTIPILNIVIPVFFLLGFLYFANAFKKIPYILSFFFTFLVVTLFSALMKNSLEQAFSLVSIMLFNSTAFCAIVMIPEPKTSPNFMKQQMIVGIISGISLWLFNGVLSSWPIDPLLNTIIVANLATFFVKIMAQRMKPKLPPSSPQPAPNPTAAVTV